MQYIRSLIFSVYMIVSTIFISFILVLTIPFPFPVRSLAARTYAYSIITALKYICGVNYVIKGKENIPAQASVVLCKHQSTWETFAVQHLFPPLCFVAKRELLFVPFFGWGLASLKSITIDRKAGRNAIKQVIKQGINRLHDNIWVMIFPEGTRIPYGTRGRYRAGGAILAAESRRPVIPVAHNAGKFWPRGKFLKTPGTITVVIGPQIPTKNRKPEDILAETENWIESTIAELENQTESDA
ncbi:MAG: 1-acyl-sn-glycerol-3-phosphate acyltransferase [Gammaproteobacteria bacterium]|nr:1-acyl-sn-glycerol-3-phosphate acyltransferase [Gammaproteobacteria bacterium]